MWFLFVAWRVLAILRERCQTAAGGSASSPRFVTSPQLPTPRVHSYELFIWYDDLQEGLELNTGDLHPTTSRPCWAYMHAKPDLRVLFEWRIAGSGSVITDVMQQLRVRRVKLSLKLK